jgi:hypothetical protein
MARNDYIFSYWIYAWYLLYMVLNRKILPSPKFALICGLIHNLIYTALMIKNKSKFRTTLLFVMVMFIIKVFPLYTLRNNNLTIIDIITTILLLFIFFIWLKVNSQDIFKIISFSNYKNLYDYSGMSILDKALTRFNI